MRTLLIALGAIALSASSASAQIDGSLRLHLEVPVLAYVSESNTPEGADESTVSYLSVGPGSAGFGMGLGYGLSEMIVLGTNLAFQLTSISPDEGDSVSVTTAQIQPYFEAVFGEGTARPFVGAHLSLEINSTENTDTTLFGLGALGGVHIFLADSFSFDISGRLSFATGSRTVELEPTGEAETDISQIGFLVLIGVSGWT
jgi:hypothetical protein